MLKRISGLLLGLVVITGSACVAPTHASSAFDRSVVLVSIQAAGKGGPQDEHVVIYNNSLVDIDVTGWCLANKANIKFACIGLNDDEPGLLYTLPSYSSATIASQQHVVESGLSSDDFSVTFEVTNKGSGSIVNSADTIYLLNASGVAVDYFSWVEPIKTGRLLERVKIVSAPDIYANTGAPADWAEVSVAGAYLNQLSVCECGFVDEDGQGGGSSDHQDSGSVIEPDIDTGPIISPSGYLHPVITELLPNPVGADTGNEFIEIYNPNENHPIDLPQYRLKVGSGVAKWYKLDKLPLLEPLQYMSIENSLIKYSLLNSSSAVQLYYGDIAIGSPVTYELPAEGESWALIGEVWVYTNQPTPGRENKLSVASPDPLSADELQLDTKAPCAANQFRNPDTGRCKLISVAAMPAPCKVGQVRNPETGRCKAEASLASGPGPCKEGQERNPETNRCRNIVAMTKVGSGVLGDVTESESAVGWYVWVAIGLVIVAVASYAVWEWRVELTGLLQSVRQKFTNRSQ